MDGWIYIILSIIQQWFYYTEATASPPLTTLTESDQIFNWYTFIDHPFPNTQPINKPR